MEIKPEQIYRHYKGKTYKIIILGRHSETLEDLVACQRQEDGNVYFRPKEMFFQNVEYEGKIVPRFALVSE